MSEVKDLIKEMEVLLKRGEYVSFLIKCDPNKEYSLKFKVWRVNCPIKDDELDRLMEEDDIEIFVEGYIKWSGCADISFGGEEGDIHLCGCEGFKTMKNVLDAVWDKAELEIKKFDKVTAYAGC